MPGRQGKYNYNTGRYGNFNNDQLKNVQLPKRIKCNFCKQLKPPQIFSKKEQAQVQAAILNSGRNNVEVEVRCVPCSGGPILELGCKDCDEWKHIDEFAKAQRRSPDTAICKVCMEKHLEFEPAHIEAEAGLSDSDSAGELDCESDGEYNGEYDTASQITTTNSCAVSTLENSMTGLSVADTTIASIGSSRVAASYFSMASTSGNQSSGGSSAGNIQQTASYGVPRSRTTGSASASAKFDINSNRRFPRIPAYRPQSQTATSNQMTSSVSGAIPESVDDAVYDEDSDDDAIDEDDDEYSGSWRDGNAVGH